MLDVRDLVVSYGKIRAVRGVSISVNEGEIVALIGANGAGKSSFMNAVCGVVRPMSGQVVFRNHDIRGLPPHEIIQHGIVQVPEGRLIFAGMTVEENLRLGAIYLSSHKIDKEIGRVIEFFPNLRGRLGARASALSGGEAQMLALARGLMGQPRLLMLDEPSLGLAPMAVREVFKLIKSLQSLGMTILLVEQNVRQALAIADRGYVLEGGRVIMDGSALELLANERLVDAYMGLKATGDDS